MFEVELKAIIKDKVLFEQNLQTLSPSAAIIVTYQDVYFDSNNSLGKKEKELRLRKKSYANGREQLILTYKEAPFDKASRSKSEFETQVSDYENTQVIFQKLGYLQTILYTKNCVLYNITYKNTAIEIAVVKIDKLKECYLEIESQISEEEQIPATFSILHQCLEVLGIKPEDLTRKYYIEALRELEQ